MRRYATLVHSASNNIIILALIASNLFPILNVAASATALISATASIIIARKAIVWISLGAVTAGVVLIYMSSQVQTVQMSSLRTHAELVALIISVSLLAYVQPSQPPVAKHKSTFRSSLVNFSFIHALAALIHFAILPISAKSLSRSGKLDPREALLISRAFSSAGCWSPFWVAGAAAVSFAPASDKGVVLIVGIAMSVVVGTYSVIGFIRASARGDLPNPRTAVSLRGSVLPLLMLSIFGLTFLLSEDMQITVRVSSSAVVLYIVFGLLYKSTSKHFMVLKTAHDNGAKMPSEVLIFVSAGVFASGVAVFFDAFSIELSIPLSSSIIAVLITATMVILGLIGIHPIVSLSILGTIGAGLPIEPSTFAVSLMIGWGLSTTCGSLSAVVGILSGHYGLSRSFIITKNAVMSFSVLPLIYGLYVLSELL